MWTLFFRQCGKYKGVPDLCVCGFSCFVVLEDVFFIFVFLKIWCSVLCYRKIILGTIMYWCEEVLVDWKVK